MRKHHLLSIFLPIVSIALISGILIAVNNNYPHRGHAASVFSPPGTIATDCSSDATSALNAFFASLPSDAVVNLPSNACYLVSNSPSSTLLVQDTSGLTINGNGTTFEQNSYNPNTTQPVLSLFINANVSVNNLTLKGTSCSAAPDLCEGDSGLLLEENNGATLDGITVTSVAGDGLDLYPYQGNDPGVNWNVTMSNSTLENIGYHAIVPEAADGFIFENSTLSSGNIDAEVDFACDTPALQNDCGTPSNPAIGVQNMTYNNDTFPNGLELLDGESCMPTDNWTVENNNFGSGGLNLEFNTTYSLTTHDVSFCGQETGLTITNNTSTGTSINPCCGSNSPYFILQGWKNVNFSNNHLVYDPSKMVGGAPIIDMCGDSNVSIENNNFQYAYILTNSDVDGGNNCDGVPVGSFMGVPNPNWAAGTYSSCGNSYGGSLNGVGFGVTVEAACSSPPPPTCPTGDTGTYPNCVAPTCPAGDTGTYPSCKAPSTGGSPGPGSSGSGTTTKTSKSSSVSKNTTGTKSGSASSTSTTEPNASSTNTNSANTSSSSTGLNTATLSTTGSSPTNAATTPVSKASGSIPVITATLSSLRRFSSTTPGKVTLGTIIAIIAVSTAIASLMIWKQRWEPFKWMHQLMHELGLASTPLVASGHSPQVFRGIQANDTPHNVGSFMQPHEPETASPTLPSHETPSVSGQKPLDENHPSNSSDHKPGDIIEPQK